MLAKLFIQIEVPVDAMDEAIAVIKYAEQRGLIVSAPVVSAPAPIAAKPPPKTAPPAPKAAPAAVKTTALAKPKAAPSKPAAPPAKDDALDLNGSGDDEEEEATGGLGLGDMFDDAPDEFKGTPEEAKEDALARLRVMLGNGHKVQVKEIQQIMRVAKFHDVPPEQGFDFLKRVKAVEAKIAARH